MARSPADLRPAAWWRSTEGVTAASGAVASWADRVNGALLEQTTAANRPGLTAAADAGNFPALNFTGNGTTQLVLAALPTSNQPYTIYAIAASREASRTQTLTKTLGTGGGSAGELGLAPDAAPMRWRLFAGGTYNAATQRLALNTRVAVLGKFEGSSSQIIVNGNRAAVGAAGVRQASGVFHVGWDPATASNGNRAFNGLLWELIYFDRALTDAEIAQLNSYASDRYGMTVADYTADVDRRSGTGRLSLSPTVAGRGVARKRGATTLPTTTKLSASGRASRRGTGSITTTAQLAAVGRATRRSTARLGLSPTLSSTGQARRQGTGTLPTAPGLRSAGVARLRGVGSLHLAPFLAGIGSAGTRAGFGVLRVVPTLRARGTSVFTGQGVLPLPGLLVGEGRAAREGTGQLAVGATLRGRGVARRRGVGVLDVAPWLAGDGLARRAGRGVLAVGLALSSIGVRGRDFFKRDVDVEAEVGEDRWEIGEGEPRWEISEGPPRWEIGVEPMVYKVDRFALEYVPIDITSTFADTGESSEAMVEVQFTAPKARWVEANWEPAVAQPTLENGAGQALGRYRGNMEPGKYDIWARVTTADEKIPRIAGTLQVL